MSTFGPPRTAAAKVCVSHVLQCASVTLGVLGACTSTNFACKLFTSLVACGNSVDSTTWDKATDDLAETDATALVWSDPLTTTSVIRPGGVF